MTNLVLFGLLIIFLVAVQFASGQTVDDVIEKYEKARGGKDKLLAIKSIYMEGSREMMGNEVAVKITKEQGKLSRTEFEMGGTNGFMLVTEKEAWSFIPMRSPAPNKMPDEALAGMQTELDIAGPLVDYVAKENTTELLGKESVDGNTCYKIKLTTKAGKEIRYWIDASTYLITQSASKDGGRWAAEAGGNETEIFTIYADYKAVDGIMFAHNIETKNLTEQGTSNGGTTFDKIEINQPIDARLFKPK